MPIVKWVSRQLRGGRATAALGALALLVTSLALSPSGRGQVAAKARLPISLETTAGTFTYSIRVEAGEVACGIARAVIRDAADWPPGDEGAAAARWRCSVGQDASAWAISCVRNTVIVRAYGPVRERNPWVIAAVRARIGVLAPGSTASLVLRRVQVRPCGDKKWLVADYVRPDGATLTIGEGRPYTCGNLGIAPRLAIWRIHGRPASLLEFCAPTGCARLWGDYALDWREHGVEITLLTHGLRQLELLAIARSMSAVPA